ncbi:T10O22.15 [Arabidopsis thaliana]|uniref:T10O22.15 n=1 Tax=Arabidopsis thaliana TaxID=3702 RepID=Q9LM31_ARATH|nr:T10O22.15 [Arabidopsis thaliana]
MVKVIDSHYLAITAIVTVSLSFLVGYQFIFFVITALFKFDQVTDFAGSTNFVILAVLTLLLKGTWHYRQIVLTVLVVVWGLRLGLFLLMRILQWGEDRRFDDMRENIGKLVVFWIFQAVWVWTVSLPVTFVNASNGGRLFQPADVIGWTMWVAGFLIEATADQQKLSFKKCPENKGKWCDVGVWKYSRHPNYFGEMLLWWGLYVASLPVLKGLEYLVIIGPVFLTLLLLFVSGIPLLEESADKKYGNLGAYRHYKKTTRYDTKLFEHRYWPSRCVIRAKCFPLVNWILVYSPLILLPRGVYGYLPIWCKSVFLFEFPLYSRNLPQETTAW